MTVDVEMTKRFMYELKGRTYMEEKAERERVTMLQRGAGEWIIHAVSPYIGDHDATRGENPYASELAEGHHALPYGPDNPTQVSVPFMNRQVFVQPDAVSSRVVYDREAARQYADIWWNSYNPRFIQFEVDCTSFASADPYFAGKAPMNYTGRRDRGWWYRGKSGSQELWSYSWAVAQALNIYLSGSHSGLRGIEVDSPAKLTIGDVINYAWDGNRFTHSTFVTGMAADGMPLVNAHTVNSRNRYWSYRDSYAWTERTVYRFYHIPDYL